ncbi:MAG: Rieske 2Fe-2S domain-containing protein [Gemmatimonadaceae bacterium]|nr:Rieske 2Fe-2S domain-containing protein [Chitinophagaceae bacterium]
MDTKLYTWHKIAANRASLVFNENAIAEVAIGERMICIGAFQNALFAFAHKCPHAGVLLSTGYIDSAGNVVCPMHQYKFNIRNGRNTSGEGYFMRHWRIDEREDGVYVGLSE